MLSVLIETKDDQERLPVTLASLIVGAVEGLVREVIVCDLDSRDETVRIAEHAGCVVLAGESLASGIRRAKGDWLLFLEPGSRLSEGWPEAVVEHAARSAGPARFSASGTGTGSVFRRLFTARRPLSGGLLIARWQALSSLPEQGDAEALARGVKARRLDAEIRPARAR